MIILETYLTGYSLSTTANVSKMLYKKLASEKLVILEL